jgi:hypothetical protein
MALIAANISLSLVLNADVTQFNINDNTAWGTGSIPARNTLANILIGAHVNIDQSSDWNTIDSTPYTSQLTYVVPNNIDGHYHFELLCFSPYNSANTYIIETRDTNNIIITYANLVYYSTTQKFYKCIQDNNSGSPVAPDAPNGANYWQLITDFTDPEVRANTTIVNGIFDTIDTARSNLCVKNALYNIVSKNPACYDIKTLTPFLKKAVLSMGACAKNDDQNPQQSEVIIRMLANMCPTC